jgi:hypothetical protein
MTPIEAILEKLTNREASICGQIHRDQRDLKKRIISGEEKATVTAFVWDRIRRDELYIKK